MVVWSPGLICRLLLVWKDQSNGRHIKACDVTTHKQAVVENNVHRQQATYTDLALTLLLLSVSVQPLAPPSLPPPFFLSISLFHMMSDLQLERGVSVNGFIFPSRSLEDKNGWDIIYGDDWLNLDHAAIKCWIMHARKRHCSKPTAGIIALNHATWWPPGERSVCHRQLA